MTLKSYIWGMRLITFFSLVALGLVVYNVDPEKSGVTGKLLFYFILFFVLSGFLNLFLLWLRRKMTSTDSLFSSVGLSFRQGILLSLFTVGLLVLQGFRMLIWWDGLLLLAGVLIIELYFLSRN